MNILLTWLVVGFLAGALARFLVPGPDPMGCFGTAVLGLVGSLIGGVLTNLVTTGHLRMHLSGFIGSVVGAMVVLVVIRLLPGRSGVHWRGGRRGDPWYWRG